MVNNRVSKLEPVFFRVRDVLGIAYWGIYGRAVSVIVLEDSKTPLGRKHIC